MKPSGKDDRDRRSMRNRADAYRQRWLKGKKVPVDVTEMLDAEEQEREWNAERGSKMKNSGKDERGKRTGTGPFRDSYRRKGEKKRKGRRQEMGEECPKTAAFMLGRQMQKRAVPRQLETVPSEAGAENIYDALRMLAQARMLVQPPKKLLREKGVSRRG